MFDTAPFFAPIVFLHIPKTAGQTIHNELVRAVGQNSVSPIRVHSQALSPQAQFPEGYRLYSGHIDWIALDKTPKPRFVFSILRDPRERIASFYFYLLKEAGALSEQALAKPENLGKRTILDHSADDYFFGGSDQWRAFILDHYDNFYCRYFGTRRIRAGQPFNELPNRQKIRTALANLAEIDWIYSIDNLGALEADLRELYGFTLNLSDTRHNVGDLPTSKPKWPLLIDLFENESSRAKLESFVALDLAFMRRLEL